jgi:hypothetical protein
MLGSRAQIPISGLMQSEQSLNCFVACTQAMKWPNSFPVSDDSSETPFLLIPLREGG